MAFIWLYSKTIHAATNAPGEIGWFVNAVLKNFHYTIVPLCWHAFKCNRCGSYFCYCYHGCCKSSESFTEIIRSTTHIALILISFSAISSWKKNYFLIKLNILLSYVNWKCTFCTKTISIFQPKKKKASTWSTHSTAHWQRIITFIEISSYISTHRQSIWFQFISFYAVPIQPQYAATVCLHLCHQFGAFVCVSTLAHWFRFCLSWSHGSEKNQFS